MVTTNNDKYPFTEPSLEAISPSKRGQSRTIDHLDLGLMKELEIDARQTNLELAKKLGISETTVRRRIQRLSEDGVIRFGVLPNPSTLRFEMAMLGVDAHPSMADAVADELAQHANIPFVAVTSGRYDVLAWVVFQDLWELADFISGSLGNVDGLATYEMMPILKYAKNSWAFLGGDDTLLANTQVSVHVDETDLALIQALQQNPRVTYKNLADRLNIGRTKASTRLQLLLGNGVIKVISFIDPSALGYTLRAGTLMKIHPSKMTNVLDELSSDKDIHRILVTSGRYDVIAWRVFRGAEDLSWFLRHRLGEIPGIISYENVINLRTVKVAFSQLMMIQDHDGKRVLNV